MALRSKRGATVGAGHVTFETDTNHELICRFCMKEFSYVFNSYEEMWFCEKLFEVRFNKFNIMLFPLLISYDLATTIHSYILVFDFCLQNLIEFY